MCNLTFTEFRHRESEIILPNSTVKPLYDYMNLSLKNFGSKKVKISSTFPELLG